MRLFRIGSAADAAMFSSGLVTRHCPATLDISYIGLILRCHNYRHRDWEPER
jgi:hypothetical protein